MGIIQSSMNNLNIISYNLDKIYESFITYNIIDNLLDIYNDEKIILCIQGIRNLDMSFLKNKNLNKIYYSKEIGLLFYTNLEIIETKTIYFMSFIYNKLTYGLQYFLLKYNNINICIINIDLINSNIKELNFNNNKIFQINKLNEFIKKKNHKINLIFNFEEINNYKLLNNINYSISNENMICIYKYNNFNINNNIINIDNYFIKIINKKKIYLNSINKIGIKINLELKLKIEN